MSGIQDHKRRDEQLTEFQCTVFAAEMFVDTGDEYFSILCYRLWLDGAGMKRKAVKVRGPRRDRDEWIAYKDAAWAHTRMQPIESLRNYEKRAFYGWHLDHVLSISEGYKRGLPPDVVGHISNLRMMPGIENMRKGVRTVFTNLFNEQPRAR